MVLSVTYPMYFNYAGSLFIEVKLCLTMTVFEIKIQKSSKLEVIIIKTSVLFDSIWSILFSFMKP